MRSASWRPSATATSSGAWSIGQSAKWRRDTRMVRCLSYMQPDTRRAMLTDRCYRCFPPLTPPPPTPQLLRRLCGARQPVHRDGVCGARGRGAADRGACAARWRWRWCRRRVVRQSAAGSSVLLAARHHPALRTVPLTPQPATVPALPHTPPLIPPTHRRSSKRPTSTSRRTPSGATPSRWRTAWRRCTGSPCCTATSSPKTCSSRARRTCGWVTWAATSWSRAAWRARRLVSADESA